MHAYAQQQTKARVEPVLRKRERESSSLEEALNRRADVLAQMRIAQMFAGDAPVQRVIDQQNMREVAEEEGCLAIVERQIVSHGPTFACIWLNAGVAGINLTRPIQDMATVWNAAPDLAFDGLVALDSIHNGIDVPGLSHIAQNLGGRLAADVARFANNLTGLSAVQVVQLLAAHPGVGVDNVVDAAVTGVWTPRDNFGGRSATDAGVGEVVDLSVTIVPPGITAADLGGLRWVITGGPGGIGGANVATGAATYTAQGSGNVTLAAQVAAGGYAGTNTGALNKQIVAPSGAYIDVENVVSRTGPPASRVRFIGRPYYLPMNVGFSMIEVREQTVAAVADGYFAAQNGEVHDLGDWIAVGPGNSAKGSRDTATDTIGTNVCRPPYRDGTFTWSIPWEYQAAGVAPTVFTTVNHVEQIDGAGRLTLSKGGASVSTP